jgi:predicted dehydrogenase
MHSGASAPAPVRIGLVGLGGIAWLHARNLVALEGAELAAVASGDRSRARAFAAELGRDIRPSSYRDVFEADDIDAVVVTSSSVDHAGHAVEALRNGKHVLVEKPGATSLADHDWVAREAEAHPECVVQVAYNRRFDEQVRAARAAVAGGEVGDPLVVLLTSRDAEWPGESPLDSGGFLLDMAVHDYDLACWFLGQQPIEVRAVRQAHVYPELWELGDVDNAVATIRFDGGGIAVVHVSRTCAFGHDVRCEVVGTDGSVLIGNAASRAGVTVVDRRDRGQFPRDYADRFATAYHAELAAFLSACREGGPRGPTLDEDRQAVAIGVAARASAISGVPLEVGRDWPWPVAGSREGGTRAGSRPSP